MSKYKSERVVTGASLSSATAWCQLQPELMTSENMDEIGGYCLDAPSILPTGGSAYLRHPTVLTWHIRPGCEPDKR